MQAFEHEETGKTGETGETERPVVLSASDLTDFAACGHLTQLELVAARGNTPRPSRDDPMLDVLARRGAEHERRHLDALVAQGRSVVEIPFPQPTAAALREAERATVDAMRAGVDVVYQATFFDGHWQGHADFLLRVEQPSELGVWSYEVADTKLARRVKAAALLQMCAYSKQVARVQGRVPTHVHVVAGDGTVHTHRLADYAAYARRLSETLEAVVAASAERTYPERVSHCSVCRWSSACDARRRADDHVVLVGGLGDAHAAKLRAAGILTRAQLADHPLTDRLPGIGDDTLARLRAQASLQVRAAGVVPPSHELLEPARGVDGAFDWAARGLAGLPEPCPGDLFFDMEGDPFALDGGLEYLFGVVELDARGEEQFHAFWAHDRNEERRAFERFVDFVQARREQWPALHVYHYAPYEPRALRRLMGSHATRERDIDEWLRAGIFIDLYAVTRQAVRLSTESYGLKTVETLYSQRSGSEVTDAAGSIVAYEDYLLGGDVALLHEIEAYNRSDCSSLVGLRSWLEQRRVDAAGQFGAVPRRGAPGDGAASEVLAEREAEVVALAARLQHGVPDDPVARTAEQSARSLLADLLAWHRREAKPDWWAYYERRAYPEVADFVEDRECIGGLVLEAPVRTEGRSTVYRYRFELQDHKFRVGAKPHDPASGSAAGRVAHVDDLAGVIELRRGPVVDQRAHPLALIPASPVPTNAHEDALRELGAWVADHGLDVGGPWQCGRDLLARRPPRIDGIEVAARLALPGESGLDAARRIAPLLRASTLAIQGPPGSGKTFTGAHVIVDLVRAGRRVGITAPSHAVIGNLLRAVCERAEREGVPLRALQKADEGQGCAHDAVTCVAGNPEVVAALDEGWPDVVAGTTWLWARRDLRDRLDVLVVDEAGQLSLADVLAVSGAAESLVLLGDPHQLAAPSSGTHPLGAEVSALEHLLGGSATMPDELGLFLETTHRMHPEVCRFVSEVVYDDKLASEQGLERQAVGGEAGLRYAPVAHSGNRVASNEEAARVAGLVAELVGQPCTAADGSTRPLVLDDVLVVAPYNAHVARLAQLLPEGARVGTVDRFQGQEAAVVVYSMATSSASDVPRGIEFLYDVNRLNVAVSRARTLAYVVCSPELLRAPCRTPEQLRRVNALCRYVELASTPGREARDLV